jgi:hypothetical protein
LLDLRLVFSVFFGLEGDLAVLHRQLDCAVFKLLGVRCVSTKEGGAFQYTPFASETHFVQFLCEDGEPLVDG